MISAIGSSYSAEDTEVHRGVNAAVRSGESMVKEPNATSLGLVGFLEALPRNPASERTAERHVRLVRPSAPAVVLSEVKGASRSRSGRRLDNVVPGVREPSRFRLAREEHEITDTRPRTGVVERLTSGEDLSIFFIEIWLGFPHSLSTS
jgi:hypothetical protein